MMQGLEILKNPDVLRLYLYAFGAGLPVVIMCGALSVLVVVKRLGFVGQGVSHSAFGGVGLAALLLAFGLLPADEPWGSFAQMCVVVVFCIATAWGIGATSDRRTLPVDTTIGVFLVGSMALGAILVSVAGVVARERGRAGLVQSWESILFGSIVGVGPVDVIMGAGICFVVLAGLFWVRRPLLFWALDEESAKAFGIKTELMKMTLMTMLAIAVVTSMKLTGVILATALLVLPGATALRVSSRLYVCLGIAMALAAVGLLSGLVLSVMTDWPAGPSIVAVLVGAFSVAAGASVVMAKRA